MQSLEIFEISEKARATLANPELFWQSLTKGESILDVFGFSTEAITGFYEAAAALMDDKRYADASDAFYFLTVMLPNEPLFWLGTARSDWLGGNAAQALGPYLMALGLNPTDTEVFLETLRCCLAAGNTECAQRVIEQALEHAASHTEEATIKLGKVAEQAKAELANSA